VRYARCVAAVVFVAAALGLALAAASRGRGHPGLALGENSTWALTFQVVATALVAGCGALVIAVPSARLSGALLMLAGPAIGLALVPGPEAGSDVLFTAALVGGAAAPALIGAAAAAYPTDSPRLMWLWPVGIALVISLGVEGVVRATLFDPAAQGCFNCPRNLLNGGAGRGAFAALDRWGPWLTIAWSILVIAVAVARWLLATVAVRRRTLAVVFASCVPTLALVGAVKATVANGEPADHFARGLWLGQCGLIVASSVLVAFEALQARAVSRRMAELALREDLDVAAVTAGLVDAIGAEARIAIVFPRPATTALGADGQPAPEKSNGWNVVTLRRAGVAAAEVRYQDTSTALAYRLVSGVRAAGLALERIGASARLQAELVDLAASRIRIIEASDAERRRLERDVHDGAQQRLIALSVMLRAAARQHDDAALSNAADMVSSALADLRRLARGIYPVTLSDMDLAVALRSLAEISEVPLRVSTKLTSAPSPAVARTVYQLIARWVQEAHRGESVDHHGVAATVTQSDRTLLVVVAVDADPTTADLVAAASGDRIEALGGILSRSSSGGVETMEVVLPCGS
jgi:signal transduction histidine kinase